jgi:hypothetical protein
MSMKEQELSSGLALRIRVARAGIFVGALLLLAMRAGAQDVPKGPLTPPPEHEVKRVAGSVIAEVPLPIPAAEVVKKFSAKEDEFLAARGRYGYHKTIRIDEFGADGKPAGQFYAEIQASRASDGKVYERLVTTPQSTLHFLKLEPEDAEALARIPAYALTTAQLEKYELKYLGTEKVDEVDTYIFDVKPKAVERNHALFEGVVWVDSKFVEVVKTYGKWVTDLGDVHSPTLPFSMFETYRENVDGKYWLPNYTRSDDVLHLQERDVPIRVTIKWTDFKAFAGAVVAPAAPAPTATPPAKPKS